MKTVKGNGVSIGTAIGSAFIYENEVDLNIEAELTVEEAVKILTEKFNLQIKDFFQNYCGYNENLALGQSIRLITKHYSIKYYENINPIDQKTLSEKIKILNQVFTPPEDEILKAKKILEQFNNSNTGLVVIDGKLIEKPVLREMQRKILIADKINKN